jgi:multicomponent Na+:H+ antiporter subunit E
MSHFALNVLLAIVWMFLRARFTLATLIAGLCIGFLSIVILQFSQQQNDYARSMVALWRLTAFFLLDLIRANLVLARDILRPSPRFDPAIVHYPITKMSPLSTAILTKLISLTPGTLIVDTEEDGRAAYIHALYAHDPDDIGKHIDRLARLIRNMQPENEDM